VVQINFTGWTDDAFPSGDDAMESLKLALHDYMAYLLSSPDKVMVHCSMGLGKTGAMIAWAHIIIQLHAQKNAGVEDPKFSIFSTIRRFTSQRFGIIWTKEQYFFLYEFM
jgi:protein tyrosine phosphatase